MKQYRGVQISEQFFNSTTDNYNQNKEYQEIGIYQKEDGVGAPQTVGLESVSIQTHLTQKAIKDEQIDCSKKMNTLKHIIEALTKENLNLKTKQNGQIEKITQLVSYNIF